MNPYLAPSPPLSRGLRDWQHLLPPPAELEGFPLSRARLHLAAAFLEDAPPALTDAEGRRQAALIRRVERQTRLRFLSLLPPQPTALRMLDALFSLTALTSAAAQTEAPGPARAAMDFLLPEACDMLYRAANLLSLEYGISAAEALRGEAELMPGRPCIAAHRHPYDDVQPPLPGLRGQARTYVSLRLLHALARGASRMAADAVAAEGAPERALYAELSLILSEHATQYGGLLGPQDTPEAELALRAWSACSLYRDLALQEEEASLRAAFEEALGASLAHLRKARALLRAEGRARAPFEDEALPKALILRADKGYIRTALQGVGVTVRRGERLPVGTLPDGADFFRYQRRLNADAPRVPSHAVVMAHIRQKGQDFRSELAPHPVELLRDREKDEIAVGR